jgi:hypothetical protein
MTEKQSELIENLRAAIQDCEEEFGLVRDESGKPITGVLLVDDVVTLIEG